MSASEARKRMSEELWLSYFNQVLFEKGVISERERNRMAMLIENRRPSPSGSQKK